MPRFPIAVTFKDGERVVIEAGRPAVLIAFADTFRKQFPDPEGADIIREMSWLAWRASSPDTAFDEWLDTVDDILSQSDDEQVEPAESEPAEAEPDPTEPGEPTPDSTEEGRALTLATLGGG